MADENPQILEAQPLDSRRAEIDTSAPFESVKEAANRFGGMGFWKPVSHGSSQLVSEHEREVADVVELEEQTAQLERDLVVKERETLDVLKELESTKNIVEELKSKLQKETSEEGKREKDGCLYLCPSEAPGLILLELKRAKLNLTKTTTDLAHIRATIDAYNEKIEKERASLEKTRERLSAKTSKISSLENELHQTKRTARMKLIAARKMKEAARASEAVAVAEMKALSSTKKPEDVTLTYEEYYSLISKAREAEQSSETRVEEAMILVDEANESKGEILKKIEEAAEEVKASKKALEEALTRVETVNRGKLAVEEAIRVWRSKHSCKKRSIHSCTKFKSPSLKRNDELKPIVKPTLSIGQILSRKLLLTEEYENAIRTDKIMRKRKVSLGQMLSRPSTDHQHCARKSGKENKQIDAKRKKFGFAKISLLVSKQSKKKKNNNLTA